MITSGKSD